VRFLFSLCLILTVSLPAFSQVSVDSVREKIAAKTEKFSIDSAANAVTRPQLPDSLKPKFEKADSLRTVFNRDAGKLKHDYDSSVAKIEGAKSALTGKIDSLQRLNLPANKYTRQLDSLNNVSAETKNKFNSKIGDLKSKTTGKLDALGLPPEYQGPISELTKNVNAVNLEGGGINIPGMESTGFEIPKFDGLPDLSSASELTGKLGDVNKLGNLSSIDTPVGDLGKVTENMKGYQGDIKNITDGKLTDVEAIPKTIEEQATKIDGVADLQKQSGVIDEYKGKLEPLKDPEAGKEKVAEMAKEAAIDHFAGKEEQLKSAMDQMAKYKSKYASVSSIKDLPKRAPNAMRGKPFIERVVPWLYFQYQQKGFNLFDFNPYAGYRISGRFTAGGGWNQRYARDKKKGEWNHNARIFGPRVYVDFRMYKGFIAHVESEVMNSFIHTDIKNQNYEEGNREWVWAVMTGLKKDYKIYKNLRGTVLIQYNLFNPKFKAPYVDRLNSRIGFEYVLKKKTAKDKAKAKSES
jgi:hypothetical protein